MSEHTEHLAENYERIWLQPLCCEEDRCWCEDPQPCDDCGLPAIKYVRADLVTGHSDMLNALEALDAYWTEDRPEGPDTKARRNHPEMHESTKAIWRQVRSAIAKARGAAP